MQPPSQDEPDSEQILEQLVNAPIPIEHLDPEVQQFLAEEDDPSIDDDETVCEGYDSLAEEAVAELPSMTPQGVMDVLISYYTRYDGPDRTGFYNALRVIADLTRTALPVSVVEDQLCTTVTQAINQLVLIQTRHGESHPRQSLCVFGPVVWDPVSILLCRTIDGTEFVCFNHPSRDPAPS